ncbi:hypothetical protein HYQ46_001644 [Verticillium longisporum]|nr:hypothetical protein HYQ46_001644 [Verticillium longisporum]
MGGILGIDATSYDKSLARSGAASPSESSSKEEVDILSQGVEIGDGKTRPKTRPKILKTQEEDEDTT